METGEENPAAPPVPPAAGLQSKVSHFRFEKFDQKGTEQWQYYYDRFELVCQNYDIGNATVDEQNARRDLLAVHIDPSLYQVLVDHFRPGGFRAKTYKQVVDFLNDYLKPTTNYLAARVEFRQCYRKQDQSIDQYVGTLKSLADKCEFGANLWEQVRDQFLVGLRNSNMQEELFKQFADHDSQWNDIYRQAKAMQSAQQNRKLIDQPSNGPETNGTSIHRVKATKGKITLGDSKHHHSRNAKPPLNTPTTENSEDETTTEDDDEPSCQWCGRDVHPRKHCPARNADCNNCGTKGHFAAVCRKSKKNKAKKGKSGSSNVNAINTSQESFPFGCVYNVKSSGTLHKDQYLIHLLINGQHLDFVYDTGSARSIINDSMWKDFGSPPVHRTEPLKGYANAEIELLGEVMVNAMVGNQLRHLPLIICKDPQGEAIFGRDWMTAFHVTPIKPFAYHSVNSEISSTTLNGISINGNRSNVPVPTPNQTQRATPGQLKTELCSPFRGGDGAHSFTASVADGFHSFQSTARAAEFSSLQSEARAAYIGSTTLTASTQCLIQTPGSNNNASPAAFKGASLGSHGSSVHTRGNGNQFQLYNSMQPLFNSNLQATLLHQPTPTIITID